MGSLNKIPIQFMSDVFIETGTNNGRTTNNQIKNDWKEIRTIDISNTYYENACNLFKDTIVKCYLGDSPQKLKEIINPNKSTTFFLDAHYSGEQYLDKKGVTNECPLLDELDVIMSFKWLHPPKIIIDDAQMFLDGRDKTYYGQYMLKDLFDLNQWCMIEDIQNKLVEYDLEIKTIEDGLMIFALKK